MDENFAFSKKSDLRKSILGRSDFFGFLDFSLCMQICYSPFHYVLSTLVKEHNSRTWYVGPKLLKSSGTLLLHIFFRAEHESDLHFLKKNFGHPFKNEFFCYFLDKLAIFRYFEYNIITWMGFLFDPNKTCGNHTI